MRRSGTGRSEWLDVSQVQGPEVEGSPFENERPAR